MKNKMTDVRDHLVGILEDLANPEAKPGTIQRAMAISRVAGTYIDSVKVEIEARKVAGLQTLPPAIEHTPVAPLRSLPGGR